MGSDRNERLERLCGADAAAALWPPVPPRTAPAADFARWYAAAGLAVGPMVVEVRTGGGRPPRLGKRPAPEVESYGGPPRPGAWFNVGAPVDGWRAGWLVGLHLGRSRLVVVDIDSPAGHPGRGLAPTDVQLTALRRLIGSDAFARPAFAWRTLSDGWALAWHLPPGAAAPPTRSAVALPGLAHTVEVRSGDALAVVPSGPLPTYARLAMLEVGLSLPAADVPPCRFPAALPPLSPDAAPSIPPALWALLTDRPAGAPAKVRGAAAPADAATPATRSRSDAPADAARPDDDAAATMLADALARGERRRLERAARMMGGPWRWAGDGRSIRAVCPVCAPRRPNDRRLKLSINARGAIVRYCRAGCALEAIDAAAPLPPALLYDRPRLDFRAPADAALAAALGRLLYAVGRRQCAMLEDAAPGERRRLRSTFDGDRRMLEAIVSVCAAAGRLEVPIARSTLALYAGAGAWSSSARRIMARVLTRYADLVAKDAAIVGTAPDGSALYGLAADWTVSTVYRLTPPPADAPAAPLPALLPGGNTARGLSPSRRGRSGASVTLCLFTEGRAMTAVDVENAYRTTGGPVPSPSTIARHLVRLERDGLLTVASVPTAGRPRNAYSLPAAAAAALGARDDVAAAALLPAWRQRRGDAVAAKVTARRAALEAGYADTYAAPDVTTAEDGWARAIAATRAHDKRAALARAAVSRKADAAAPLEAPAADAAGLAGAAAHDAAGAAQSCGTG